MKNYIVLLLFFVGQVAFSQSSKLLLATKEEKQIEWKEGKKVKVKLKSGDVYKGKFFIKDTVMLTIGEKTLDIESISEFKRNSDLVFASKIVGGVVLASSYIFIKPLIKFRHTGSEMLYPHSVSTVLIGVTPFVIPYRKIKVEKGWALKVKE